jgi:hypothetical protein
MNMNNESKTPSGMNVSKTVTYVLLTGNDSPTSQAQVESLSRQDGRDLATATDLENINKR